MTTCILGSKNPVKIEAARNALSLMLQSEAVQVVAESVPSGVPDQPMSESETRLGAVNRVKACMKKHPPNESGQIWYIAIEGGVDNFIDGPATFAFIAINYKNEWSVGRSANLPLPQIVYKQLCNGQELGVVMDKMFNTHNIKQQGGAIGLLTNHLATRQSVYELALILALARFQHPKLYLQSEGCKTFSTQ